MTIIIFSFNRALQLKLLLDSIKKNMLGNMNIFILYKYSNENFKKGYNQLISENILPITWVNETNFKNDLMNILSECSNDFISFLTDDDIIYQKCNLNEALKVIDEDADIFTFSLRLGFNVNYCYTLNCNNILIPLEQDESFIKWDWTKHYADYSYPLSVDGHIFRTKDISKLISKITFHNPNTLEGNLQIFDNYPKEKMASYKHSVLVNTPTNIVNQTHPNRKGEKFGISPEELNDKYLNNNIISLEDIDFTNIYGCHQELDIKFISKY